jgi:hypothetical protein
MLPSGSRVHLNTNSTGGGGGGGGTNPRIDDLTPQVTGLNQSFTTPVSYVPGTLQPFRNGVFMLQSGAGQWTETGASSFVTNFADPNEIIGAPDPNENLTVVYIPL